MAFHIGRYIKLLIKKEGLKAKEIGMTIHKGKGRVYRIYNQAENIPSAELIKLSVKLKINLFSAFRNHEAMASIPDPVVIELEKKVNNLMEQLEDKKNLILDKDKQIKRLEQLIDLLEKQQREKEGKQ